MRARTLVARALGMLDANSNVKPGRGCAGFPYVVYSRLYDPLKNPKISPTRYLSEHAKAVYSNLSKGLTLHDAVEKADLSCKPAWYDPMIGNYRAMGMISEGDPMSRLISVYTGNDSSPDNPDYLSHPDWYPYLWKKVIP